jgi:TPR repeat protein
MRVRSVAGFVICIVFVCISGGAQTPAAGASASDLFENAMNALVGSSDTRSGPNAIEYFRRSAEMGYAPAQVVLGYLYETGRILTPDPREAFDWYQKAALQDDPLAQWLAARMIYAGLMPGRDLNQASDFLQSSAKHGNPFGEYLLGKIKLERQDYSNAAEWFRKAAEQGLPQAQEQLAALLKKGQGIGEDKFAAYVWMLISTDAGNRRGAKELQSLEPDLGTNQVEQAKAKAREMEGSVNRSLSAHGCTGWPGEFDVIPAPPPPDLQRFCR